MNKFLKKLLAAALFIPALSFADPVGPSGTQIRQIQDEGVGLTRREKLNFTGAGVNCVDNAGNLRTDCTITAGGGGASSLEVFNNFDGTRSSPTASIGLSDAFRGTVIDSTYTFHIDFSSVASKSDLVNVSGYRLEPATVTPRFDLSAQVGRILLSTANVNALQGPMIFVSSVTGGQQFGILVSTKNINDIQVTAGVFLTPGATAQVDVSLGGSSAMTVSSQAVSVNSRRQLRLGDSDNSNYAGFVAPTILSTNLIWRLPLADASGCLSSDGSGNLSITTCGSGGGGGATVNVTPNSVLFSTGGTTISGDAGFQYDSSVSSVTVAGLIGASSGTINSYLTVGNFSSAGGASTRLRVAGFGQNLLLGYNNTTPTQKVSIGFMGNFSSGDETPGGSIEFTPYNQTSRGLLFFHPSGISVGTGDFVFSNKTTDRSFNLYSTATIRMWDGGATERYMEFRSPDAVTSTYTIRWPTAPGTAGQVLSINSVSGTDMLTEFTTPSGGGGGGSSSLAVGTGTASNFTNNVTSPTAAVSLLGSHFVSLANGSTNFVSLNLSSVTMEGKIVAGSNIALTPGTGTLTIAASPPGSNTQITYNNAGSFGSSSDFTWDNGAKVLDVNGMARTAAATSATSLTGGIDLHRGDTGKNGIQYFTNNMSFFLDSVLRFNLSTLKDFRIPSDHTFSWSSLSTNLAGSDTGVSRNSAGVVEINNGTPGSFGALVISSMTASGTINATKGVRASTVTITGLTSQACIGTDGAGNVQAGTCGGSGGASSLEVFSNFDSQRTSPTASISIGDTLKMTVSNSTAVINVDLSSVTAQGNVFNTGSNLVQLSGGLVPNALVDGSSVTKQGVLVAGSNITLTPGAGTLTIAASGGGGSSDFLSTLVSSEIIVGSTVTATIGRIHVCTGTASDFAINLPAASGNGGKFVSIRVSTSNTRLITIDANGSEMIDGELTRIMWAGESATLMCDGSNWTKISGKTIPMTSVIIATASQSGMAHGTFVVLNLASATVNVGGMADPSNNQIRIRRPGNYFCFGNYTVQGTASGEGTLIGTVLHNSSSLRVGRIGTYSSNTFSVSGGILLSGIAGDTLKAQRYYYDFLSANRATEFINPDSRCFLSVTEQPSW